VCAGRHLLLGDTGAHSRDVGRRLRDPPHRHQYAPTGGETGGSGGESEHETTEGSVVCRGAGGHTQ